MIIPTRSIRHADGKLELARVVNPSRQAECNPDDPLPFEASLLWLLPLESLDYVRVAVIHNALTPDGPIALKGDVALVGYSKLSADAPVNPRTQGYTRRLFYLIKEDGRRNLNDVPDAALDPASVLPGHTGSPPAVSHFNRAYPRHIRRRRRSVLRNPVALGRILAQHHRLEVVR